MTPAPITPSRSGTAVNSSAPVESTIRSSVTGAGGMSTGHGTGRQDHVLRLHTPGCPVVGVYSTCDRRAVCRCRADPVTPLPLKSPATPPVSLSPRRLCARSSAARRLSTPATAMPTSAKCSLGVDILVRGIEQRLGGNAAPVQTGAAVSGACRLCRGSCRCRRY